MGDYLYNEIDEFVTVINDGSAQSDPPGPTFTVNAFGGNLAPTQFNIAAGAQQVTRGAIAVPAAYLGSEGTYPLDELVWSVSVLNDTAKSYVNLVGTVTYVTVETPDETETTQTINVEAQVQTATVPLNPNNLRFLDQGDPTVTFIMLIDCGTFNMAASDDESSQTNVVQQNAVQLKRAIRRKKQNIQAEG